MVLKGFNSEIIRNGTCYHIQTEDWGKIKRSITTKVFKDGAVISSVVKNYQEIITGTNIHSNLLINAMKKQHEIVLSKIKSGHLE